MLELENVCDISLIFFFLTERLVEEAEIAERFHRTLATILQNQRDVEIYIFSHTSKWIFKWKAVYMTVFVPWLWGEVIFDIVALIIGITLIPITPTTAPVKHNNHLQIYVKYANI